MSATQHWLADAPKRAAELERRGVFWRHDGNPKRPYVRLRSGLISNGYFNGGVLVESPAVLDYAVKDLVFEYSRRSGAPIPEFALRRDRPASLPDRIIGPAMGAITLAHEVARQLDNLYALDGTVRTSFTEKDGAGFAFKRNPPRFGERLMFVEDTVTTAGSVGKVMEAAARLLTGFPCEPYLVVLCNRTGRQDIDGLDVVSYVDGDFQTWKEGENPFTPDHAELVPVVENAKENWSLLTQDYP